MTVLRQTRKTVTIERRRKVAELLLQGVTNQCEICRRLGMPEKASYTISRDITEIHSQWLKEATRSFDELVARELTRLDKVESEYWEAWNRSKAERQLSKTARRRKSGGESGEVSETAEIVKEQRDGNPAFLDGVMKCVAKRCELLGIDAPKRFVFEDSQAVGESASGGAATLDVNALSLDQVRAYRELRQRITGPSSGPVVVDGSVAGRDGVADLPSEPASGSGAVSPGV